MTERRHRRHGLTTVDEALVEVRAGRFLIVVDSPERENEGDLVLPAEAVTPDAINFMAKHGRGLICIAMEERRLADLGIPLMIPPERNTSLHATSFAVSVDARRGVTTGISAYDRAQTVRVLIDPRTKPDDIVMPGHMFPLRARPGGVLVRAGHTEATIDLCRLAGRYPAGVLCEIMKSDGAMARLPDLKRFARRHGLKILAIEDLIAYRLKQEQVVERVAEARLPTWQGWFRLIGYRSPYRLGEHIALVMGEVSDGRPVLTAVREQCVLGDVFGSLRCECAVKVEAALDRIAAERRGVFIYLQSDGRGIGLHKTIRARASGEGDRDRLQPIVCSDYLWNHAVTASILADLGAHCVILMADTVLERAVLQWHGVKVVGMLPAPPVANGEQRRFHAPRPVLLSSPAESLALASGT